LWLNPGQRCHVENPQIIQEFGESVNAAEDKHLIFDDSSRMTTTRRRRLTSCLNKLPRPRFSEKERQEKKGWDMREEGKGREQTKGLACVSLTSRGR
jgi:hypothetical protein